MSREFVPGKGLSAAPPSTSSDANDWSSTLRKIQQQKAENAAKRRLQNERNAQIIARMETMSMGSSATTGASAGQSALRADTSSFRPSASSFVSSGRGGTTAAAAATHYTNAYQSFSSSSAAKTESTSPTAAEFVPGQGLKYQHAAASATTTTPATTTTGSLSSGAYASEGIGRNTNASYAPPTVPPDFYEPPSSLPAANMPRTLSSVYLPDDYLSYYQLRSYLSHAQVPAGSEVIKQVPKMFNCILPLDTPDRSGRVATRVSSYDYPNTIFKVVRQTDGVVFALRRVDKVRSTAQITQVVSQAWNRIDHVGIVPLRGIFQQSGAIFFLHDYKPGAKSVRELYLETSGPALPEAFLWDVAVSMASSIFAVHNIQMACRCVNSSRVLVTGRGQIWLGSSGVIDVLEFESKKGLTDLQREDLIGMGTILLEMTTRISGSARASAMKNSIQHVAASGFSPQWTRFLLMLLTPRPLHIQQVMHALGPQTFQSLANATRHAEVLDRLLHQQMENGRLMMLLIKMGLVDGRPNASRQWTETGNAYLLKLFRDYIFYETDAENRPVINFGHTIGALNKLDCGSQEKIVLMSRDGKSMMVVSYADIQSSVQRSFEDLLAERPSGSPATASFLRST